jgi:hypothetical protein
VSHLAAKGGPDGDYELVFKLFLLTFMPATVPAGVVQSEVIAHGAMLKQFVKLSCSVPPDIRLAVTGERWKQLVGQKGTRGFVSSLLGVAPEQEVVRSPMRFLAPKAFFSQIGRKP